MSLNNGDKEKKRTNFVLFDNHQLSDALAPDVAILSQACDAVAAQELLATYQSDEFIGSNGNISQRNVDGGFLITGTQLPAKHDLGPADFVHILDYTKTDSGYTANYHGTRLPSSESLMHWHLYESFPEVEAVVHVHEFNDRLYGNPDRFVGQPEISSNQVDISLGVVGQGYVDLRPADRADGLLLLVVEPLGVGVRRLFSPAAGHPGGG